MSAPQFLHIDGFIHEIDLAATGSEDDPWPFHLTVNSGQSEASCLVHEEDARQLVEFLQNHLQEEST